MKLRLVPLQKAMILIMQYTVSGYLFSETIY